MNDIAEQRIAPATIRKVIEVDAPIDRAFHVFTARMGDWWNKDFTINRGVPQKDVIIDPRPGGRWYEIGEDGSECTWGRVLEWDAPNAIVLAWQINADWNYDSEFETIVDVRFKEEAGRTTVTLEHRQLERYGEAMAQQAGQMDGGWGMLLDRFRSESEMS